MRGNYFINVDHCIENLNSLVLDIKRWYEYLGQIDYVKI